ncbi:MAG: RidA family protein [Promethearchaeia archaeon]
MVDKEEIIVEGQPKAGPYSLAIKTSDLLFVSGQVPSPDSDGIKEQTLSAFENVKNILEAAGVGVENIVKVTVYLSDKGDFRKMNRMYKKFFEDNGVTESFPARTTIEGDPPIARFLIEIDVIAAL